MAKKKTGLLDSLRQIFAPPAPKKKRARMKDEAKRADALRGLIEGRGRAPEALKIDVTDLARRPIEDIEKTLRKAERAATERDRLAANREWLLTQNVPIDIIKAERLDSKGPSHYPPEKIASLQDRAEKLQVLRGQGYTYKKAQRFLGKTWDEIYSEIDDPKEYMGRGRYNTLYVGVWHTERHMITDMQNFENADIRALIENRWDESQNFMDDSTSFAGVYRILMGTADEMERKSRQLEEGENKTIADRTFSSNIQRYREVFRGNAMTEKQFLNLVYDVITQVRNDAVQGHLLSFYAYCARNGLPFFDRLHLPGLK